MPELPEVEVLVRHLAPLLKGKTIRSIDVHRERIIRPDTIEEFTKQLVGRKILSITRRAKFLIFSMSGSTTGNRSKIDTKPTTLLGHLGMTGRMYLQPARTPLPKHAAVSFDLGRSRFIFEDTRYFGRMTLDLSSLDEVGPEPLSVDFSPDQFFAALKKSSQPIKVKLLDQKLVAGIGNIYASEALFRSRISPRVLSRRLTRPQVMRLHRAIRDVLQAAIETGSTIPLDFNGTGRRNGLFYYGQTEMGSSHEERLLVYDRANLPCSVCGTEIRRIVQTARSTFFCPKCQQR
jgi:formamidopyrimidine-DNA glycosylase